MLNRLTVAILGTALFFVLGTGRLALAGEPMVRLLGNHPASVPAVGVQEAAERKMLSLTIGFSTRHLEELESLQRQQRDPSSPLYHRGLQRGEFVRRFRPSVSEYASVVDWLKAQGFKITSGKEPQMWLWCEGTVAQVEAAFSVKIVMLGNGLYWNEDDPEIPTQFYGLIDSIAGLDNLSNLGGNFKSLSGQIGFGVNDLRTFYNLNLASKCRSTPTIRRC
jgi:subtilase family serine protease